MKLKATVLLLSLLFIYSNSFTQDIPDYVWKTPMSKVYPTGEAYNLPQAEQSVNYQNPNTVTRTVKVGDEFLVLPPNVRPFPHTATQSEVDAANMIGDGNKIYASWNSYGPSFWGTGFAFSSNGGTSWTGNFQMFNPNSGDPGAIIFPVGSNWPGRLGLSVIAGFGHSDNNGATWQYDMNFPGSASFDKNFSAVDDISDRCSPFFGRAYTVWTEFAGTYTNRIVGSYSTDGGATWSTLAPVSPPTSPGHHHQGCDIKVGRNGNVHVVWANCTSNGQNSTEDSLGYARSTDGGVTWVVAKNNAADMNGVRSSNLFNGIRASGFPRLAIDKFGGARNGWLYSVAAEKTLAPAGDASDVVLIRSTDNGVTWTRIKVNQDPSNGRFNYMPAIVVTPDGAVNVSYYDQRNTTGFVTQTYLSRSTDGGTTFNDVQLSDHNFTPAPISGLAPGYQGDYTGITYGGQKIWPFWADNSSGVYQVWTEGISTSYTDPALPVNDVKAGPFLGFPGNIVAGTNVSIKARISNIGTGGQTNLPLRFIVNGSVLSTNTMPSLPSGANDSTAFSWTPASAGNYTVKIASGAPVDDYRCNDTVSISIVVLPTGTVFAQNTICRNGLSKPILDNQTTLDTINVNIPNSFNVIDVNVRIDTVIHTYDGDLAFTLSHLAGSSTIINRVGSGGDNFIGTVLNDSATTPIASGTAPFSAGPYIPSSPLSAFNGLTVNGLWVLAVADMAGADQGTLRAWCLTLTYQTLLGGIGTLEIPNYYSLSQNYPNPFNPSTTIKFSVPKADLVKLKVYDVLGREVAVLVNELKQPGFHTVDFNASNLASGIYFYKIEAGDFTAVKKLMVVK